MNTTELVVEIRPEKISGPYKDRIRLHSVLLPLLTKI